MRSMPERLANSCSSSRAWNTRAAFTTRDRRTRSRGWRSLAVWRKSLAFRPHLSNASPALPRDARRAAHTNSCGLTRLPGSAAPACHPVKKRSKGVLMQMPKAIHELEYAHGSIYGEEEKAALLEVLADSAPSCGPRVKAFEEAFAAYC